nr:thiamine ABC transporter substrate-binding protein [uncultured Albidiferax sp.]
MLHRRTFSLAAALAALSIFPAQAADIPLRVLVHSSFDLPKPLLARFETESGVKLSLIKAGDAGEMLNKLILTRSQPIADVVFGLDNASVAKAQANKVLEPVAYTQGSAIAQVGANVVPVDYGFVNLNFDKAAFAKSGLALPKTLEDLAQPAYRNLLVVPNPATSSPGYAFLLATIAGMGEEKAFDWWARMRGNGVKAVKGWTEAYYTEFSRNGGTRPLVVSYASSPAAEVFYSKEKITESPTGNLFLKGGVFRQVEGVALVAGGGQREAAAKFIRFMRSGVVQEALQTSMWMYPVEAHTPLAEVMKHAVEPSAFESLPAETIADKGTGWVARWTQVVLK